MAQLLHHPWPGNVRELKNVVNRSVLLARGPLLGPSDLQFEALGQTTTLSPPPLPPESVLSPADRAERERIATVLDQCAGNQTRAAKVLGISRRKLINQLDKLGFVRPRRPIGSED
jgi:DNA-binding NtrC family response regulator